MHYTVRLVKFRLHFIEFNVVRFSVTINTAYKIRLVEVCQIKVPLVVLPPDLQVIIRSLPH